MKKSKLIDILNFSLINKDLFIEKTNNAFYKNEELLYSKIEGHSSFKNNIVVLFSDYAFLINETLFKRFDFRFNPIYLSEDTIFVKNELSFDRKKYSYFLYDHINSKVSYYSKEFYFIGHPLLVFNQLYLVKEDKKTICNLEIKTETTLWQYSVIELGAEKVSKILGVFGQTLVVVGYIREYTYMLLGLDVQSGQLLWKHEEVFAAELHGKVHPVKLSCIYADTETGKLILFEGGVYAEFEGSTGNILKWINIFKSPLSFGKYQMDTHAFDICDADEEYIYFRTSVPGYGMYSGAGIFNRKTDQLEFLDVILSENGRPISIGPQKVKATKEKFYVLDNQNTLHIYERE